MKKIILITIILLMLAAPVFAQSASYFHEVTIELDGEWNLDSNFSVDKSEIAPAFRSGVTLEGVGRAKIHSITKAQFVPTWWQLF